MPAPPQGPQSGFSPKTRNTWIWATAAVAALLLFAAMSWQAWTSRGVPAPAPAVSPTVTLTPTATRPAGGILVPAERTPDVSAGGSNPSPGIDSTSDATTIATIDALVAAVLTRLPAATPAPAPDLAATATAQAQLVATVAAQVGSDQPDPTATLGLWLSAVSAITALIGLVSSALLGWRRERREAALAQAELEKTRLEVAKLQRELDQVGRQGPAAQAGGVPPDKA